MNLVARTGSAEDLANEAELRGSAEGEKLGLESPPFQQLPQSQRISA